MKTCLTLTGRKIFLLKETSGCMPGSQALKNDPNVGILTLVTGHLVSCKSAWVYALPQESLLAIPC